MLRLVRLQNISSKPLDKANVNVIEDTDTGTLNIKVDTTEGFKVFTEVTIQDDVNMEDVLITAIDVDNQELSTDV